MTFKKLYEVEQQKQEEKKAKKEADLKLITPDPTPDLNQKTLETGRPEVKLDAQKLDAQTPSVDAQVKLDAQKKLDAQDEGNYPSRIERGRLALRLPNHKLEQYKIWCFINKISIQDAIEKAMDLLLDAQENLGVWTSGRPVDHDLDPISEDPIDDKLSSIMEFYSKWTSNKVKEGDKEAYKDVANLDEKIIQVGILLTVVRAKNRIGSFKYCIGAIEEASKQKIGNPDSYIKYLLDKISKGKIIRPK